MPLPISTARAAQAAAGGSSSSGGLTVGAAAGRAAAQGRQGRSGGLLITAGDVVDGRGAVAEIRSEVGWQRVCEFGKQFLIIQWLE